MPTRPCLGSPLHPPGHTLTNLPGSRCPTCTRHVDATRTRSKRARRPYTATEQRRRAAAVQTHIAAHGYWCPGWRTPPHPTRDLTADHPLAVAAGGAETQELEILCRSCNSRKGATPTPG
jgi:5-methylcytosine-specific restriction protein A